MLRRIIRRAVRHGNKLGAQGVFFHKLVGVLADVMGSAGEELKETASGCRKSAEIEEETLVVPRARHDYPQ